MTVTPIDGSTLTAGSALAAGIELEGLAAFVRSYTVEVLSRGRSSAGSGVIWHADGLIVTNAHVIRDARPQVALGNEEVVEARVVAIDKQFDLALLSVGGDGMHAAPIGDAESLRAGSLVLALGHPMGVHNALSLGVVHTVTTEGGLPRYIAADVRLAPGNSGGPLVDTSGRVVGINAMIVGGLGVAIPSTVVRRFLRRVSASGAVNLSVPLAA